MTVLAWLNRNGEGVQAAAGLFTALVALGALIIVPWQIGQAERIQKEQAARDIYREFLNISIQNPKLQNTDWCAITDPDQKAAYQSYVEYLLYTSEQVIGIDADWAGPMTGWLNDHASYVCSVADWSGYSSEVQSLASAFKAASCSGVKACP